MTKDTLKKYRALSAIAGAMIFNLIESLLFAQSGHAFNLKPMSIGEWVCDIISTLIFIFGIMMATYDMWSYKPKEPTFKISEDGKTFEFENGIRITILDSSDVVRSKPKMPELGILPNKYN